MSCASSKEKERIVKKERKGIHDVAIILFPCPGFLHIYALLHRVVFGCVNKFLTANSPHRTVHDFFYEKPLHHILHLKIRLKQYF